MSQADLERIREWAAAKLSAGRQPNNIHDSYVKLRETVNAILGKKTVPSDLRTSRAVNLPGAARPKLVRSKGKDCDAPMSGPCKVLPFPNRGRSST
jgi:hypothetical protein